MQRKFKIILVCLAIPATLFFTHIIGVLTFYRTVVPFLGPVLPRPDGVPRNAEASFNWKGFGLFWSWETKLHNGCASWGAAKTLDYSTVRLVSGESGCKNFSLSLEYTSGYEDIAFYNDQIVIDRNELSSGEPCPFKISNEKLESFSKLIFEAKKVASKDIEQTLLNQIETRLAIIDGQKLTADHSKGCNGRSFQ